MAIYGGTSADFVTSLYKFGTHYLYERADGQVEIWDKPQSEGGVRLTELTDVATGAPISVVQVNDETGIADAFEAPAGYDTYVYAVIPTTLPNGTVERKNWVRMVAEGRPGETGPEGPVGPAGGSDAATAEWVESGPLTTAALSATFGPKGGNVARFIERARAGEALAITCVGTSIFEGNTVTDPATDGVMHLLQSDLETRFGNSITMTNHATSGYTIVRSIVMQRVKDAIEDEPDLFILEAFDKNDIDADIYGTGGLYATGVPLEAATKAIERVIRSIRQSVPKADIIVCSTNPFAATATASNAAMTAKDEAVRRVAAAYGCEWVDLTQPFLDLGDYSALLADSTHPNTAGHRLMADTLLEHLEDRARAPIAPGQPGETGLYNPEEWNMNSPEYGYLARSATNTYLGGTYVWANTGAGWTGVGPYVTAGVGDYAEFTFAGSELHLMMVTDKTNALVADVMIDGVTVATGQDFTLGKNGTYYVPIAVGLDPTVSHTARLTLVSGTMQINSFAAARGVMGTQESPQVLALGFGTAGAAVAVPTDGSVSVLFTTNVALPGGWAAATVQFTGYVVHRVKGTSTAIKEFNSFVFAGATFANTFTTVEGTTGDHRVTAPLAGALTITEDVSVSLRVKASSTSKTQMETAGYNLTAILTRVA